MSQELIKRCNVKFYGTPEINTTIDNSFYCIERKTHFNHKYKEQGVNARTYSYSKEAKWIKAKDLKRNIHFVGLNLNQKSINISFGVKDLNEKYTKLNLKYKELPWNNNDFYWFLGRYLADGWYQNGIRKNRKNSEVYKTILCCNKNEVEEVEEKLNTLNLNYTKAVEKTVIKYIYSNLLLTEFVKKFGKYAYGKKIPQEIQDLPIKYLIPFIKGYQSGDGYLNNRANNLYKITTTSVELAYGFQNLIHKVYKLPCRISKAKTKDFTIIEGRIVNQRDFYTILYRLSPNRENIPVYDGKIWFPLRKDVELINKRNKVYDMQVEEDYLCTVRNIIFDNEKYVNKEVKQ